MEKNVRGGNILIISNCALLTSPNTDVNELNAFLQEYVNVLILQIHEKYSKIAKVMKRKPARWDMNTVMQIRIF